MKHPAFTRPILMTHAKFHSAPPTHGSLQSPRDMCSVQRKRKRVRDGSVVGSVISVRPAPPRVMRDTVLKVWMNTGLFG